MPASLATASVMIDPAVVVVVSGLPRSGTSMMMRMLEAGGVPLLVDGRREADEDNPLGYYELEAAKNLDRDSSWIADARGKAVKVVSALLRHLPVTDRYRIVFMRRDLDETIASQNAMLVRQGKTAEPAADERMRELFTRHLERVSHQLAEAANVELLELDYADVIKNPATAAGRVSEFLGGSLDVARMAAAVEARLYRQRRPD